MYVENTAAGWKRFADSVLRMESKGRQTIKAETSIKGNLDNVQLFTLQYSLIEFDRIEAIKHRQYDKHLSVSTHSTADAYRVLHYLYIVAALRRHTLHFYVYANDKLIAETGPGKKQNSEIDPREQHIQWGRIFPLLCIGTARDNLSIVPYGEFVSPEDPKLLRTRFETSLKEERIDPPNTKDTDAALELISSYYLGRIKGIYSDLSGTQAHKIGDPERKTLYEALEKHLLQELPQLSLLARVLWTLSIWTMARSGDLLKLSAKGTWELDMETVHCCRLDAISYGEGLQQLLENACIHSQMKRAYLSIRIHYTDITNPSISYLKEAVAARTSLNKRLLQFENLSGSQSKTPGYQPDPNAKYYFEFQVLNDSMSIVRSGETNLEQPPRGIAEMFFTNRSLPWPPGESYTLKDIFSHQAAGAKEISQHYGLRILEKTVRLNGGYFGVFSPGREPRGGLRLDYYLSYFSKNQSFSRNDRQTRCTCYNILLPIMPHWHDAVPGEAAEKSSQPQVMFNACALSGESYFQKLLRFQLKESGADALRREKTFFVPEDHLQSPEEGEENALDFTPLSIEEKVLLVERLQKALEAQTKAGARNTVYLLDFMRVRDYILVELLAKMLFLFLAQKGEALAASETSPVSSSPSCTPPSPLFALLFPAKEYTWEFIRIFSIFYDKLKKDNAWMANTQIALCGYADPPQDTEANGTKRPPEPEVNFLLAGGTSASARVTARTFAYYNTGATMEMIPQLRYLTRDPEEARQEPAAVPQFPFDLFLSASTAQAPSEMSWFLRKMDSHLQRDLWRPPLGCRLNGIKVRLKSNICLTDFYEAELLFHNIGIIYRFAYLIARDIIRQLRAQQGKGPLSRDLILVGYEFYSSVLTEQVKALIERERILGTQNSVHYTICSSQASEQPLHLSPELQSMEAGARNTLMGQADYIAIVPIGTTLSTIYHIQRTVEGMIHREKAFPYENYVLILVGSRPSGDSPPLYQRYWEKSNKSGLVTLKPWEQAQPSAQCRFFLEPKTEWLGRNEPDRNSPTAEQVLVYVDQTSTLPKDIFVVENAQFRGVSSFLLSNAAQRENDRRMALFKGCVNYGHLVAGNNHFQFYLDMDRYFAKAAQKTAAGTAGKTIDEWLRGIRETIEVNAYNIIVSPLHQEDSPFAKAVIDHVFEHSLRFLHVDLDSAFREDIRAKFSYVAEEYRQIRRFDRSKPVNVYFVNTAITSGATLLRARNLIMMLLEESGMQYDRDSVFKGCFVLVNRSGFDTLNSYVGDPLKNFHAYVHLAVPSFNVKQDRCPTCNLIEQYRRIERRCSTGRLRREFHRLAEKHARRDMTQYTAWMQNTVISSYGYANWLRQWLFSYVRKCPIPAKGKTAVVGIFQDVSREEVLRLRQLFTLMSWGLDTFLEERLHNSGEDHEQFLSALNSFSLKDLERLVKENRNGAIQAIGSSGDPYCLQPEYWKHVILDYVCGQKNYLRLEAIHRSFIVMDRIPALISGKDLRERGEITAEHLLKTILATLKETDSLDLQVEWLISYLKVLSRPHLAQYHHIRQGIMRLMLQMTDCALRKKRLGTPADAELRKLYSYLWDYRRYESQPTPLLQYQLLQTLLKRLAGLQSTYLLQKSHIALILKKTGVLRKKYFAEGSYRDFYHKKALDHEQYKRFNPFPMEEEVGLALAKLVKWTSSCGDDENGCFLIEKEFRGGEADA